MHRSCPIDFSGDLAAWGKNGASPVLGPAPIIKLVAGQTSWLYSVTLRATLVPGYIGLHR
jgi:hypothetical protein